MIVKCQMPLSWSEGVEPMVRMYNEDRTFELFTPYNEVWRELFKAHGLEAHQNAKFFAHIQEEAAHWRIGAIFDKDLGW